MKSFNITAKEVYKSLRKAGGPRSATIKSEKDKQKQKDKKLGRKDFKNYTESLKVNNASKSIVKE